MSETRLDPLRSRLLDLGEPTPENVARAMRECGWVVTDDSLRQTISELRRHSLGAGILDDLLAEPGVSDVVVNGPEQVFVDRGEGLERVDIRFVDDGQVRRLATRMAAAAGRRLDDASPYVDGRLADGTRLHAILSPLAEPGTCISLRVPARRTFSLVDLVQSGSICAPGADLLRAVIEQKLSFLISGGTGTGKTTLLGALLGLVDPRQRIVIVEDSRELNPNHPHCVWLEGRPPNAEGQGAISLTMLVRQSLRMRPDRVVLGEVRGGELTDLLSALNTGHEGGCGTVHANSIHDVPARLEALAALGGLGREACHAQVISALTAVLHVRRLSSGQRRIEALGLFQRDSSGISIEAAVEFTEQGLRWGPAGERLRGLLS